LLSRFEGKLFHSFIYKKRTPQTIKSTKSERTSRYLLLQPINSWSRPTVADCGLSNEYPYRKLTGPDKQCRTEAFSPEQAEHSRIRLVQPHTPQAAHNTAGPHLFRGIVVYVLASALIQH